MTRGIATPGPGGAASGRTALVVGAGFAGLAAGLRLRAHGFAVTVLDREPSPGGRARSVWLAGAEIDPCAALLFSSDRALASVLAEIGQPDELEPWAHEEVLRAGADGSLHRLRLQRPSACRPPAGVRWREAARSVRFDRLAARHAAKIDRTRPERGAVLDDRSAAEWAMLYFGPSVLSAWISPWLSSMTLGDDADASRLLFLLHHACARDAAPATLRAGPGALAEALARRVPTRLGVAVDAIEPVAGGGFEVAVQEEGRSSRIAADAIVLAVPPRAALAVGAASLSTAEKDHLAAVRMRPALTVGFVTRRSAALPSRRIVGSPGHPLLALQRDAGGSGSRPYGSLVAVASAGFAASWIRESDDVVVRRLTAETERIVPGVLREVEAARVVRFDEGLPCFGVGHYRALEHLRSVEASRVAEGRRLVVAGDYTMGPRIEDAIASGLRAADALASVR